MIYSQDRDYFLFDFALYNLCSKCWDSILAYNTYTFEGNFYVELWHWKRQLMISGNKDICWQGCLVRTGWMPSVGWWMHITADHPFLCHRFLGHIIGVMDAYNGRLLIPRCHNWGRTLNNNNCDITWPLDNTRFHNDTSMMMNNQSCGSIDRKDSSVH